MMEVAASELAGLSPMERGKCRQADIRTTFQLVTTAAADLEKQSKGKMPASEIARLQSIAQVASIQKTESSLWNHFRRVQDQEQDLHIASAVPATGTSRSPLHKLGASRGHSKAVQSYSHLALTQIIPATPGQDDTEIPLVSFKDLPPSPPQTSPISRDAPAEASCSRHDCLLCTMVPSKNPAGAECRQNHVPSGIASIDSMLRGGFRRGTITDLAGESCTGKTQFMLQTVMRAALGLPAGDTQRAQENGKINAPEPPNWDRAESVAILVTAGKASVQKLLNRLIQLVEQRYSSKSEHATASADSVPPEPPDMPPSSGVFKSRARKRPHSALESLDSDPADGADASALVGTYVSRMLKNIHIAPTPNLAMLERFLERDLPGLSRRLSTRAPQTHAGEKLPPLGLIVIDELPSLLSESHNSSIDGMMRRSRTLCSISDHLKLVAAPNVSYAGATVLVVNHVTEAGDSTRQLIDTHQKTLFGDAGSAAGEEDSNQLADFEGQAAHSNGLALSLCKMDSAASSGEGALVDEGDSLAWNRASGKVAQLGPIWTNCVNARLLFVTMSQKVVVKGQREAPEQSTPAASSTGLPHGLTSLSTTGPHEAAAHMASVRQTAVAFAPWCRSDLELSAPAHFIIRPNGLASVSNDEVEFSAALPISSQERAETNRQQEEWREVLPSSEDPEFWLRSDDIDEDELAQAVQEAEEEAKLGNDVEQTHDTMGAISNKAETE